MAETERMDGEELAGWRQAWRGLQEAGSPSCPPEEALAALAVGEPEPEERLALADHVASCRRCAALYRDLLDLHREAQRAAPAAGRSEAGRTWVLAAALAALFLAGWSFWLLGQNRRLAAELAAAAQAPPAAVRGAAGAAPEAARIEEALRRLATLGSAAAAQTERISRLEGELAELRAPRFNVPVVDLDPTSAVARGEAAAPRTVAVPAGASLVTLILNASAPPAAGSYGLEILDAAGRRVWAGSGLRPTPWDNFSLAVPRSLLPDGRYRLRLATDRGKALETYEVQIATLPAR
jgi:hypothetical protein